MRARLFIGEMEADLTGSPDILFTFQTDDVSAPSAVKNSYSKTVTLVGSKRNNRIFDQYWLNGHTTLDGGFDPSKKTPFKIFVDSELVQEGYCRLDKVTTKDNLPSYSLSLFGGLGEFLYALSEKEDGSKKTLADLKWFVNEDASTPTDLSFTINQDTVKTAWDELQSYSSKWSVLNFAPALNGIPQNFSADKCLMIAPQRTDGPIGTLSYTEDGRTYAPYSTGGYILAEMNRDRTADEMREFRSYLMRPVLSVRKAIENICRPENCNGWKVNLDGEFFKADNPWWSQAWVTLPSLTSLEYTAQEEVTGVTMTMGSATTGKTTTGWWSDDDTYYESRPVTLANTVAGKVYTVNANITLKANIPGATTDLPVFPSARYGRATGGRTSHVSYLGSIFVQLVAYDAGGNAVAGSKLLNLTGPVASDPNTFALQYPYGDTSFDTYAEGFSKESTGVYTWGTTLPLTMHKVPRGCTVTLWVIKANHGNGSADALLSDEDKGLWARHTPVGNRGAQYDPLDMSDFTVVLDNYAVTAERDEAMRSNTEVRAEDLLKTSYTPCDFLLSYCKMFGLYLVKDPVKREIDILSRKSFFLRDQILDIEGKIDRTQTEITPLVAKARWYRWDQTPSGEYADEYKKTYGKDYGEYDYATSYGFDSNTEDVLKGDKVFKGAVQVLERGTDFWFTGDDTWKPWMYDGYKYVLYDTTAPSNTHEVNVPLATGLDVASHVPGREYYDIFDKVQLHGAGNNATGGEGVLLFFDRFVDLKAGTQTLKWYITDDNAQMAILNDGQPCWFWPDGEYDYDSVKVATRVYYAPKFSRMLVSDAGYVLNAWDFGAPEETYVPEITYREDSTIFKVFWESYVKDLYDRDTRKLKTKMLIEDKVSNDWLRRFYTFSDSVWRMDKIENCDIADRKMTDVEFVKVQDVANYDNMEPTVYGTISIQFSPNPVPSSGGTVQFTVDVSDGGAWYLEAPYDSDLVWSATAGTGNYTGTVTVPANGSTSERTIAVYGYADPVSCLVYLGQEGETAYLNYLGTSPTGGTTSDEIPASGGSAYFNLVASTGWTLTGSGFASVTPSAGTATTGTTIEAVANANTGSAYRECYLVGTTTHGATFRSNYVRQEAQGSPTISVSPSTKSIGSTGETFTVSVTSNVPWQLSATYGWLTISPTSGASGTTTVTVVAPANSGSQRTSDIRFASQDAPTTVLAHCNVTQYADEQDKFYYKSDTGALNVSLRQLKNELSESATTVANTTVSTGDFAPCILLGPTFPTTGTSLTYVDGKQYQYPGAFQGFTQLTKVRWYVATDKEAYLRNDPFSGCTGLTSIEIYGGIPHFSNMTFTGCTSLETITVQSQPNAPYSLFDGPTHFNGATNLTTVDITYPGRSGYTGTVTFLSGFSDCGSLETVTIRNNWTSDNASGGTVMMVSGATSNCPSLTTVSFIGIEHIRQFNSNPLMFSNCPNLTDIWWDGTTADAQTDFATTYFTGCPAVTIHCSDGTYTVPSTL